MPVPGPRTQFRPLPGYTNPGPQVGRGDPGSPSGPEHSDRINPWLWPKPVVDPGRSPGTMTLSLRGCVLAAGQVRRLWRQSVNLAAAQSPYSWTDNAPQPGRPEFIPPNGVDITRALRYMARSLYVQAGTDDTRLFGLHTRIQPHARSKPVSLQAGNVRSRPTTRNRLSSFGSRIPPINPRVPASQ